MAGGISGQIMRFGVVGAVGFLVDGSILWALTANGMNPLWARAISFPVAVVVTWLLNRSWTFRGAHDGSLLQQFGRYFTVQLVGNLTNYIIYAVWIVSFGTAQATVFTGFVIGSGVAAIVNFVLARQFAFRAGAQSAEVIPPQARSSDVDRNP